MLRTAALLGALALGCADDATQIVVVVDGESTLREVSVEVVGQPDMLSGAPSEGPTTAVLRHTSGALGPHVVRVRADTPDGPIAREARVTFVANTTQVLPVCMRRACASVGCDESQTCGGGVCRPIEDATLEPWTGAAAGPCFTVADGGVDAGVDGGGDRDDAGPSDGGPDIGDGCGLTLCGVEEAHLPGDPVRPEACDGRDVVVRVSVDDGGFMDAPVTYFVPEDAERVEVEVEDRFDPTCSVRATFVVPTLTMTGVAGAPSEELRDMDARAGTAFVVGRRGLFGGTLTGWHEIMRSTTPEDLQAVRMYSGEPHVGQRANEREFFRVSVSATHTTLGEDALTIADEDSEVYAMAREASGLRLLLGTKSGLYLWDGGASIQVDSLDIGRGAAVALSSDETLGGQGPVWAGEADGQIFNFGASDGRPVPSFGASIGILGDIEVEDDVLHRLWICGTSALEVYERIGISDRSAPITANPIDCRDLAMARGGGVWAATGLGLERYDSNGARRVLLRIPSGATHVASSFGADHDEVWVLGFDRRLRVLRIP